MIRLILIDPEGRQASESQSAFRPGTIFFPGTCVGKNLRSGPHPSVTGGEKWDADSRRSSWINWSSSGLILEISEVRLRRAPQDRNRFDAERQRAYEAGPGSFSLS